MADASSRSLWGAAASFAAALLAGSHHWLHVTLASLGLAGGALVVPAWLRGAMLAVSLVASALTAAWLLRSDGMPAARFWGAGVGVVLSVGLLSYGVTSGAA
ncbi:MAG TPA: hypothetical protein VHH36_08885 [Candidatus Thermoplasmatota archaeon]|nr:hypothetical protein [Candidatus Thermoplasmatota archaeon]